VFSAAGLLFSNVEHTRQQSVLRPTRELDARALASAFAALEAEALQGMAEEGIARSRIALKRFADLRYAGQAFELTVPVEDAGPAALEAAFHAEHERTYGHSSQGDPVDLINLRVVACAAPQGKEGFAERLQEAQAPAAGKGARQAFFAGKLFDTPVLSRAGLKKKTRGPLIVEEFDATCVVPPGAAAALDAHGNILIDAGEP
jgi:N-methylhydantoinase A